ncbi:23S rRNA (adenine(2030)-N(6))-methyltransferase RlmJ [Gluconobacter cerinus]|uniref:Ribosomal RNA large subunit methyltransferase J n=1 Tax=Gluconobacter cerinus TaxID=38307 RepID=A0A1B6VMN2_9PROT|nr:MULTISPECIES: 23S rRNA (adenine(2030)-N(6))-methyltransferase RlmJ [Gluconobacter]MBS0993748.1 23S rRNA (adenine(2030)-N(6))-methyltransferase RlmJ [Gluconobacter cerinus]MBS1021013.1 23S rRNA (adenine(2030)-N(6))-methyltransferase RlmJ [Gluconobacter cerinus]OAJ68471.1 lactate dehydrogenase [Gluconobacter cerinus]
MNYRHAYHAGNFADCMKHAILLVLLKSLARKPAGFCVLDTHAGCGQYDLSSEEAQKTGEWKSGIGRLLDSEDPALQDYLSAVRDLGLYPGSPALARHALRPQDQLVACELHPEDVRPLRRLFRDDPQVSIHHRNGYEALRALLPPKDLKRGLVLIDPPFEKLDDFTQCAEAISLIRNRFRAGIVAVWYPIKHRTPVRAFYNALKDAGIRDILACEFLLRPALDPSRLNGCGMLVVNAPFGFEEDAARVLNALKLGLATDDPEDDMQVHIERLVEE